MISPWEWSAKLVSPNGKVVATIEDAMEIAMGAPTSGRLKISNEFTMDGCNPSMVWSSDSEYLAVPQWTMTRKQKIVVYSLRDRKFRFAPGEYRVLQLDSFDDGIVKGIDSPIHLPRQVCVNVSQINWRDS